MTPRDVAELLLSIGAVELRVDPEEWFTWASGKRAPVYCDNRLLMSYPEQRSRIADALVASVREHYPDVEVLAGTATAGIAPAAWVAERMGLPMAYVRGTAKGHGQQKRVEGRPLSGERVVVIEDLISYGGSSGTSVQALSEEGGKVIGVQAIFTYGFAEAQRGFDELGVQATALSSYDALLELLDPPESSRRVLLEWRGH